MKKCYSVIGLGYGDEGKGVVTSSLCLSLYNTLVVRYSGGQQAGHTVIHNGISHVFSNFGSGTLSGKPTYWSKYCTFDPEGAIAELQVLKEKKIKPTLFIDLDSPITTPYDKIYNQKKDFHNGTCGLGVGPTYEREENKYSLKVRDLLFKSVFKIKLNLIKNYYTNKISKQDFEIDIWDDLKTEIFHDCCEQILQNPDIFKLSESLPLGFDNYIFEGSQGLMLDQDIGFFPHVTRSSVGTSNILKMCDYTKIILVTRAFQTRHGNGPLSNENICHKIKENSLETNSINQYQGRFRKSLLDVDMILYGMSKDSYIRESRDKELVITCLDLMDCEYLYTRDGEIITCNSEEDFAKSIAMDLGMSKVSTRSSPLSIVPSKIINL